MATHRVAISSWALDHKIPPGSPDWRGFNASFVNRDVTAFDLARQVYDGHAFTTWHKDNWRTTANFVCGQHIGLDFDNGDQHEHHRHKNGGRGGMVYWQDTTLRKIAELSDVLPRVYPNSPSYNWRKEK